MHRLRRWFWLVPVVTVAACAIFAARAANALLETVIVAHTPPARGHPRRVAPPAPQRVKDGDVVVSRNIFCTTCDKAAPSSPSEAMAQSDGRPPLTSLPIALIATFGGGAGLATIANAQTGRAGLYAVGDTIPGAGPIRRVGAQTVELWNATSRRLERMELVGAPLASVVAAKAPPARPARPAGPEGELLAAADRGVKRVDERHFQVERGLLDKVLGDPMALSKQGRVLPVVENGQAQGFRVSGVQEDSVFAKIGLKNGDVIRAINGMDLTSPDKLLDAYSRLRSASNLAVTLARAGAPVEIEYAIR